MGERTQEARQVAISTALGEDVLLFRRATIVENLGRMFQMEVDVFTEEKEIKFADIVGQAVTIRLEREDSDPRIFHGFVSRIVYTGGSGRVRHYHLTVSPWLWFLTRSSDCRIFQDMTAPDIIKKIFQEKGFSDFKVNLHATYAKREYCVQYRETDFNFVSRLMEEEGIYYYFEHDFNEGKHFLVMCDEGASHEPLPGYENIPYFPPEDGNRDEEYIWEWVIEQEVQPGKFAQTDYNFEKPKMDLKSNSAFSREHAVPDFEMFDYHPGRYRESVDGDRLSKVRLDEFQSCHEVVRGAGDVRGMACGWTIKLDGFPSDAQNNVAHLITSVVHELESDEYSSGDDGEADAPTYECRFTAILASQQFRPRRLASKPTIYGPQTAFVTGPSGQEIHTDKHGRVKVQFHWDREGTGDDKSSCWIRVGQMWASSGWGSVFLPRVGMEVVVAFLEGDPDQPLVVGTVYNAVNVPPIDLPANKTMSGIISSSSTGGNGFNMIRFEDKAGEEDIFVHAQKDHNIRVEHDTYELIGNDRNLIVTNDQKEEVKNDRHEKVTNNHNEEIGKDRNLKVKGKQAIEVGESHSLTVKGDVIEVFKKNHSEETTADYYVVADNVCIEGKTNITIKVGDNYIAIDSSGLKICAAKVVVESSSGTLDIKSAAAATFKAGATLDVEGTAPVTIKGAKVAIN